MAEEIIENNVNAEESDAFESAFSEITNPPADGETPPEETPPEETPPEETPPEETPPADAPPDEAPPADAPPADKGEAEEKPGIKEAPNESEDVRVLKEQIAALQAAIDAKLNPEPPKEPEPEKKVYTPDEEAAVKQYQEEWPEVHAGERLIRKQEYVELVNYIFDEVAKRYEPLIDFYQNSSSRNQYSDIVALVPDYDDVRDKTLAWIDTQPTFLKKAYSEVTETGTPEEIASLINIFKKETGYVSKQTAPTTTTGNSMPKPAVETKADPAKTAAAASLKVVKAGRSSVTDPEPDKMDFEGSFDEAIRGRKR